MATLNYFSQCKNPRHRKLLVIFLLLGAISASWLCLFSAEHLAQPRLYNDDGRNPRATLEVIRSQIDLFKTQHQGNLPSASLWNSLRNPTDTIGNITITPDAAHPFGPYVQGFATNPVNGQTRVAPSPSPTVGWVYVVRGTTYTFQQVNTTGNDVLPY